MMFSDSTRDPNSSGQKTKAILTISSSFLTGLLVFGPRGFTLPTSSQSAHRKNLLKRCFEDQTQSIFQ